MMAVRATYRATCLLRCSIVPLKSFHLMALSGYKFGGWSSAVAKQYTDTAGCSLDADASWAPSFP